LGKKLSYPIFFQSFCLESPPCQVFRRPVAPSVINSILDEFITAGSVNHNGSVIILYPGTEDERRNLSKPLQQQINSLGNDYSTKDKTLAILPVSPLDILSVERIARAVQWWLYTEYCQIYPFTIQAKIPDLLLEQNSWIVKEGRNYKLLRSPRSEEQDTFNKHLSNLITETESRGAKAKAELSELQNLNNFVNEVKDKFKPLLTCPTCHKKNNKLQNLDRQCFRCVCDGCKTEWGKRICVKCSVYYPYMQLSDFNTLDRLNEQAVGLSGRLVAYKADRISLIALKPC